MAKAHETVMALFLTAALFCVLLMPMYGAQQMGQPVQMPPALEIEVTSIVFSDTDAIEGQAITISVTVENMNLTMAVDNITLTLSLDYGVLQNFTNISLDGAESATYEYTWDSESGTHNVTAMLIVGGVPLPDTQVSEELVVGLGDIGTILIALLATVLTVLVIAALPSVLSVIRK